MSEAELKEVNAEMTGQAVVLSTQKESHMWDSATCVYFLYEFASVCLKMRRKALGVHVSLMSQHQYPYFLFVSVFFLNWLFPEPVARLSYEQFQSVSREVFSRLCVVF